MPNDPTLSGPDLSLERLERRRLFKILGGVALGLLVILLLVQPTRRAIKGWQARRHAATALALIDQEQWKEATAEARAAYQLRATEPAAIRAIARLLSRTGQGEALGFWKTLRATQPLTRQDVRDEATAALVSGEASTAEEAIKQLLGKSEGGPGPADELLAAQIAVQLGHPDDAGSHLDKVVNNPKASERQLLQALLMQLTLNGSDQPAAKQAQTAAWTRLTKIARGKSSVALDALMVLAQRSLSRPNEIVLDPAIMPDTEIIQALEAHPRSRTPQKLVALDLRMHLDSTQRATLIEQAIATWKTAGNESVSALGRWLNSKGEFQKELDTIPLQRALQTRDLFLQRLDALGSLGQWSEIERLLQVESFPLDPVIECMYLARCNQQLGEVVAGENNWQRAFEAAAGDPQKLLTLADYAEKNGASKIAETAYNSITHDAPRTRPAQQGRLRLAQQSRNTAKIHGILADMLAQWPNDSAIQNDEAYTRLLLSPGDNPEVRDQSASGGSEVGSSSPPPSSLRPPASDLSTNNSQLLTSAQLKSIEALAEDLVKREPASLPHRTLLALARLRQDQAAKAFEVYSQLRIPPNAASPSAIAVHAAVLAGSGHEEDARTEAGAVNWNQLLPEEQALVANLR